MILTLQTGCQYHTEKEQLSTIPLCHCGQLRLNDKRLHISHTLREHGCLGEEEILLKLIMNEEESYVKFYQVFKWYAAEGVCHVR